MGRRFFEGWIPLHRLATLTNLWGGAGKFRKVAAGRNWSLLLVRRDDSTPPVPPEQRPTLREAIDNADRAAERELGDQLQAVLDAHTVTYHPGRTCRESERGECADRFGSAAQPTDNPEETR